MEKKLRSPAITTLTESSNNAKGVVASLQAAAKRRGGILCAPHSFVNGSSAAASVLRISEIMKRSRVVGHAYSDALFANAREQRHLAMDRVAQMALDHSEYLTLQYALMPEVAELRAAFSTSVVTEESVRDRSNLLTKVCKELSKMSARLNMRNVTQLKRSEMHDKLCSLRRQLKESGESALMIHSFGKWNGMQAPGSHWSGRHPRMQLMRRMQQTISRRARFKLHCVKTSLECINRGVRVPEDVKGGLLLVDIQSKQISEIRSSKQACFPRTLYTRQRIDTKAPPQTLFPFLEFDRPWKLRYFYDDVHDLNVLLQRDAAASFELAWLGFWERYAFDENFFRKYVFEDQCPVLLRPAVFLFHTDYDKWKEGTLQVTKIIRF